MAEAVVSGLGEVVGLLENLVADYPNRDLWWRGQDLYDWELTPGIFRGFTPWSESNFNLRFRTKAKVRYPNCPPKGNHIEWLHLAQHYGLPTRLLDWSESIAAALYFSVAKVDYFNQDGALYCLLPSLLNKNELGRDSILMSEDPEVMKITNDAFRRTSPISEHIVAFLPDQFDLRHIAQNTAMTIHGRPGGLDKEKFKEDCLLKIRVKCEGKKDIRRLISYFGANRANLFPDLANLAKDIKQLIVREVT
jgi:FRG domain